MNSGSDSIGTVRDYLAEGHLTIGVIPINSVGIDEVHVKEVRLKTRSPERRDSSSEEEEVTLNRPLVRCKIRRG